MTTARVKSTNQNKIPYDAPDTHIQCVHLNLNGSVYLAAPVVHATAASRACVRHRMFTTSPGCDCNTMRLFTLKPSMINAIRQRSRGAFGDGHRQHWLTLYSSGVHILSLLVAISLFTRGTQPERVAPLINCSAACVHFNQLHAAVQAGHISNPGVNQLIATNCCSRRFDDTRLCVTQH